MKKRISPDVNGATEVEADGTGSSVSLVVSQPTDDPGQWLIEIRACFGATFGQAGRSYTFARVLVPPRTGNNNADRVIFIGCAPGAQQWSALVTKWDGEDYGEPATKQITVDLYAEQVATGPAFLLLNGAQLRP